MWNPHVFEGKLGKLLGGSESVVRAGFSFKRFTEPYQSYWEYASDFGNFFYNNTTAAEQPAANGKQVAGTFAPQSLTLTQAYNAAGNLNTTDNSITSPTTLVPTYTQAQYTYQGGPGIVGMKQNIAEPIVMSWNLGIQRKLGASRALEVRYAPDIGGLFTRLTAVFRLKPSTGQALAWMPRCSCLTGLLRYFEDRSFVVLGSMSARTVVGPSAPAIAAAYPVREASVGAMRMSCS